MVAVAFGIVGKHADRLQQLAGPLFGRKPCTGGYAVATPQIEKKNPATV